MKKKGMFGNLQYLLYHEDWVHGIVNEGHTNKSDFSNAELVKFENIIFVVFGK